MSITDPSNTITFFQVQGRTDAFCLAVDDVSSDALTGPRPPDIGLPAVGTSDTLVAGRLTNATLVLHHHDVQRPDLGGGQRLAARASARV